MLKKLARDLYASESSIRRDLTGWKSKNLLKRIHGGAILDENALSAIKSVSDRELEKKHEKMQIASKQLLTYRMGIDFPGCVDSAYNIIPYLAERKNIM